MKENFHGLNEKKYPGSTIWTITTASKSSTLFFTYKGKKKENTTAGICTGTHKLTKQNRWKNSKGRRRKKREITWKTTSISDKSETLKKKAWI